MLHGINSESTQIQTINEDQTEKRNHKKNIRYYTQNYDQNPVIRYRLQHIDHNSLFNNRGKRSTGRR